MRSAPLWAREQVERIWQERGLETTTQFRASAIALSAAAVPPKEPISLPPRRDVDHAQRGRKTAEVHDRFRAKGLSQMDLVRDHDWTLSHYQKIERGVLDTRFSTLLKLAEPLGVTVSELLQGL
jgi:hypothetical protein